MKFAEELEFLGLKNMLIGAAERGLRQLTVKSLTVQQQAWLKREGFVVVPEYDYVIKW